MSKIMFPITVNDIKWEEGQVLRTQTLCGSKCGDFVAVRPCADEYEGKTFLGIMLGDLALSNMCQFDRATGEITISHSFYNPAMFIPDRNAVVFGVGSYWSEIESEAQLKQITNDDINNQWYVRALKWLAEREKQETATA